MMTEDQFAALNRRFDAIDSRLDRLEEDVKGIAIELVRQGARTTRIEEAIASA